MKRVFIIAEAGVNHNGDLKIAKKLIDAARKAGADAIKFQSFKAELLMSRSAPKAAYQKETSGSHESQFEMIKRLELNADDHRELIEYAKKKGIVFLSSPFDTESVDLLMELGVSIIKIPSGEINNLPYLKKIGPCNKKIILSTGMSDLDEIRTALGILERSGTVKKNITVLHANTQYPTPFEDANLRSIVTIQEALGVEVGYSDHTPGIEAPIAAIALGATVIEKHLTLDRTMKGPDHQASLEPDEFERMVDGIRNTEKALGSGIKKPSPSEIRNKAIVRKSIMAHKDIAKGELFSEENIITKRPGTGLSPMEWDKVVQTPAKRNFKKDEFIEL